MPLSRDSSYDDWDPDLHLPVIEETETVFYGEEEDDVEDVAALLPEPQGHPKAMGPEPSQLSALAETPVPKSASHPKTVGCTMVRGDGSIHCRYCEHERYSLVMCLVCQARFDTSPTYLAHLRSVQHHWNMRPPPKSTSSSGAASKPPPAEGPKWKQLPPFKGPPPKAPVHTSRSSGTGSSSSMPSGRPSGDMFGGMHSHDHWSGTSPPTYAAQTAFAVTTDIPEPASEPDTGNTTAQLPNPPQVRAYTVWRLPISGNAHAGIYIGSHPQCWNRIRTLLPGGQYTAACALRKVAPDYRPLLETARIQYNMEADRWGAPLPARVIYV